MKNLIAGGTGNDGDDGSNAPDEMDTDAKKQEGPSPDAKKQEGPSPGAKKQEGI